MINIDNFSDISKIESAYKFSMNSEITNSNSYKILLMNVRNVIEKKMLFHLMLGFNSIKYLSNEQS
jgi:hypothetical protein